jgi:valine--pyruvate aminotransferase
MEDLGAALHASGPEICMLGGGNPAHIPALEDAFAARLAALLADRHALSHLLGDYPPPAGDPEFRAEFAKWLAREYGLPVTADNVLLTPGSQASFFMLFNLFAGEMADEVGGAGTAGAGTAGAGGFRRILLPLAPEYIGYTDCGIVPDLFVSARPQIDLLDDHNFKYRVDFDALTVDAGIGAVCCSRPTNPTGNILTDEEMARLLALTQAAGIPFLVDNAYGAPFPEITNRPLRLPWADHVVHCMSLSKLGLPGTRTGIVVASAEICHALAEMNAVLHLAPSGVGAALILDLLRSGALRRLCREEIAPFYRRRAEFTQGLLHAALDGMPYAIHKAEGAIFLWLWLPDLPIPARALYERLKARDVLVVSGEQFFPGLAGPWRHREECLRLSYAAPEDRLRRGIEILGEEVRRAHEAGASDEGVGQGGC